MDFKTISVRKFFVNLSFQVNTHRRHTYWHAKGRKTISVRKIYKVFDIHIRDHIVCQFLIVEKKQNRRTQKISNIYWF